MVRLLSGTNAEKNATANFCRLPAAIADAGFKTHAFR